MPEGKRKPGIQSIRLLLCALLILLLCAAAGMGAFASADGNLFCGDWEYRVLEDGSAQIVRYHGRDREVRLNWNLDRHLVTEIGPEAFAGCDGIVSVELPVGLRAIWAGAFRNCASLEQIALPENLKTIGDEAFLGCTALREVVIPDSVVEWGADCFEPETVLMAYDDREIAVPRNQGESQVFYIMKVGRKESPAEDFQVQTVNGQITVTSYVGKDYEVIVPAEINGIPVTAIGENAFSSRYGVESVILPEGLTRLEKTAFRYCTGLKTVQLPPTLKEVGDYCFYRCERLEEIVIPEGTESLGIKTFYGCKQLKSVTLPASLKAVTRYTFYGCSADLTLYAPKDSAAIGFARGNGIRYVETE